MAVCACGAAMAWSLCAFSVWATLRFIQLAQTQEEHERLIGVAAALQQGEY